MNTKTKTHSLMHKTMLSLIIAAIIITVLLVSQLSLTGWYYEKYMVKNVDKTISKITEEKDIEKLLDSMEDTTDLCFQVVQKDGTTRIYNEHAKGCVFRMPNNKIRIIMGEMQKSPNDKEQYKIVNPEFNSKTLLYGIRLDNGNYIYVNAQLENLDQTSRIISKQMGWFIVILFVILIILSVILSKTIAKPISDITDKAKKLADGKLNTKFTPSNISEINELTETLNYAKNEIVKTSEYRRDLMANVGHDLRTPLTLIKSYAEMVRDISYKDEIKRNNNLNVIINETDRLNELVNDIIELSKIETSVKDELEITEYDLSKQINGIVGKFEILEMTENYHFKVDIPKKALVHADQKKINQVIYNLINNAINYTGDDQTVFINVKSHKEEYKVEIIDTGKGIDKETIKHVWDRYYKTEKKHKRNKVGTGLGLAIVREILEKHDFKYGVNSTVGKGTNFYFYIKK